MRHFLKRDVRARNGFFLVTHVPSVGELDSKSDCAGFNSQRDRFVEKENRCQDLMMLESV